MCSAATLLACLLKGGCCRKLPGSPAARAQAGPVALARMVSLLLGARAGQREAEIGTQTPRAARSSASGGANQQLRGTTVAGGLLLSVLLTMG